MKQYKTFLFIFVTFILLLSLFFLYFFSNNIFTFDKRSFKEKKEENIFPQTPSDSSENNNLQNNISDNLSNLFSEESNKELLEKYYKNYILNKELDNETIYCLDKVSILNPNPRAFISMKYERNVLYGDYEYKGLLTDLVEFNFENCQFVALRLIRGDYLFSIYIPSKMPTATGRTVNYPKDLSKFINKEITVYVRYALTEDKNSKLILGWDLRE